MGSGSKSVHFLLGRAVQRCDRGNGGRRLLGAMVGFDHGRSAEPIKVWTEIMPIQHHKIPENVEVNAVGNWVLPCVSSVCVSRGEAGLAGGNLDFVSRERVVRGCFSNRGEHFVLYQAVIGLHYYAGGCRFGKRTVNHAGQSG